MSQEKVGQIGHNLPDTTTMSIGSGEAANYRTIEIMKDIARKRSRSPIVRQLALKILLAYDVPSNYYINEAIAIADYVKQKVRYVRDIDAVETLHDPLTIIDQIKRNEAQADCDDMALLIATLLLSIGHQPSFKIVKYKKDSPSFNHIYVVVYEKNPYDTKRTRIALDAIIKDRSIGYEVPHEVSDEIRV